MFCPAEPQLLETRGSSEYTILFGNEREMQPRHDQRHFRLTHITNSDTRCLCHSMCPVRSLKRLSNQIVSQGRFSQSREMVCVVWTHPRPMVFVVRDRAPEHTSTPSHRSRRWSSLAIDHRRTDSLIRPIRWLRAVDSFTPVWHRDVDGGRYGQPKRRFLRAERAERHNQREGHRREESRMQTAKLYQRPTQE